MLPKRNNYFYFTYMREFTFWFLRYASGLFKTSEVNVPYYWQIKYIGNSALYFLSIC